MPLVMIKLEASSVSILPAEMGYTLEMFTLDEYIPHSQP